MRVAILADFPLHVIPEFGENYRPRGHYATWLPQLANAYASFADIEAHWVVLSARQSVRRDVFWNNQFFHVIPTSPSKRASTLFARDRKAIRACLEALKPQLVHGWGAEDVYALAAVTSGFSNIVSMQGILSHYIFNSGFNPRDCFQALLELYVLRKADCVTVEGAWGRDLVHARNRRALLHIVEYGVQDHFFKVEWEPDARKPAAIFVGSITPRKGIQDAIQAFRSPALANSELWIAGSGDRWAEKLRAEAPPNVKWLGRKSTEEIAGLLSRAWCLVLPTRADTSPNVVKEARVIGLPVISTPCGGQTAYIDHGKNGFLVAPGDVETLAQRLGNVLSDYGNCRAMGAYRHREHRELLNPRRTAEGFYRLYQRFS